MPIHATTNTLTRLSQNAATLASELTKEHEGETRGATQRPALIEKLRSKIREDVAALELGGE